MVPHTHFYVKSPKVCSMNDGSYALLSEIVKRVSNERLLTPLSFAIHREFVY